MVRGLDFTEVRTFGLEPGYHQIATVEKETVSKAVYSQSNDCIKWKGFGIRF